MVQEFGGTSQNREPVPSWYWLKPTTKNVISRGVVADLELHGVDLVRAGRSGERQAETQGAHGESGRSESVHDSTHGNAISFSCGVVIGVRKWIRISAQQALDTQPGPGHFAGRSARVDGRDERGQLLRGQPGVDVGEGLPGGRVRVGGADQREDMLTLRLSAIQDLG